MVQIGFTRAGSVDAAVIMGLAVAIPVYAALLPLAGGLHWSELTPAAVVAFALAGLFGAGIGRRWLFTAIERIGAAPATALKNTAPLFTTALAIPILGERVGLVQWAAVLSIIAGITLVSWRGGGGARQLLDVGVIAALGSALSYGIRPLILKFGLTEANLPIAAVAAPSSPRRPGGDAERHRAYGETSVRVHAVRRRWCGAGLRFSGAHVGLDDRRGERGLPDNLDGTTVHAGVRVAVPPRERGGYLASRARNPRRHRGGDRAVVVRARASYPLVVGV